MRIAVYPGSFDPVTLGHLDIIKRSANIFDKLIVAVLSNGAKNALFSVEERVDMLRSVTKDVKNTEVHSFSGLLVEFVGKINADVIIKGLRAVSDFEYEFQMALINTNFNPEIETLFLPTSKEYMFLSSSIVKEVARHNGKLDGLVPVDVIPQIMQKF